MICGLCESGPTERICSMRRCVRDKFQVLKGSIVLRQGFGEFLSTVHESCIPALPSVVRWHQHQLYQGMKRAMA